VAYLHLEGKSGLEDEGEFKLTTSADSCESRTPRVGTLLAKLYINVTDLHNLYNKTSEGYITMKRSVYAWDPGTTLSTA